MARNLWLWVALFLLGTNVTLAGLWWKQSRGRAPTRVLRVTPQTLERLDAPLTVTFSRPMVVASPARGGDGKFVAVDGALVPEIRVEPAVELTPLWRSPTTLELRPRAPFRRATPYELIVSGRLLDADGYPLGDDGRHRFETPRLRFFDAQQVALSRDFRMTLRLSFSDSVPLEDLDRSVRFTDGSGAPVPMVRRTPGDIDRAILFESDAKRRERIHIALDAGLCGVSGPLGLARAVSWSVEVEHGLQVGGARGSAHATHDASIDVDLSLRVNPDVAKGYLEVEPEVLYAVERRSGGLRLRGRFEPGKRYRLTLRSGLPGEGGRLLLGDVVRTVRLPDLAPALDFVGAGEYLNAGGRHTLVLRSVNVDRAEVTVERVFPNNLVHYLGGAVHVGSPAVASRTITIDAGRNEARTTPLDVRDLAGEWKGPLVIRARAEEHYARTEKRVTVTDLGVHIKVERQGFLVWVVRLSDLAPVDGARVVVHSREDQKLLSGRTDSSGLARLDAAVAGALADGALADGAPADGALEDSALSEADRGEPFVVSVVTDDDFSFVRLDDTALSTSGLAIDGRPYPVTPYEAFLYAERGVLRPGETLHFRAVVRELAGEAPQAGMPLRWEIVRSDHRVTASFPAILSRFGTCELAWTSARDDPTGRYTARLRVPGEGPVLGDTTFRVEEFVPKTLRVTLQAEEKRYAGGGVLPVDVRAESLFGAAADGLVVQARCELRPLAFEHDDWPDVRFTSSDGTLSEHTLRLDSRKLDGEGRAKLRFEIPADLNAASALQAVVTVSVVEVSGRATTTRIVRPVDPRPFYLGARMTGPQARVESVAAIECVALRADGTLVDLGFLATRLVRVSWDHALRRDPQSSIYRWRSEKTESEILARDILCHEGRGLFEFTPELAGDYELHLEAPRGEGEAAVKTVLAFFVDGTDDEVPEGHSLEVPGRIEILTDRKEYRVGDVARLRVESPITGLALLATETTRVHEARVLEVDSTASLLELPITSDLAPDGYVTLTIVRSSLGPVARGVPVRAYGVAPLSITRTDRTASLGIDLPEEVRPGAPLELTLQFKNSAGPPEEVEVAVALVDAGILALTGFKAPDPAGFFSGQHALGTRAVDLYAAIVPEPRELLARALAEPGGGGDLADLLNPVVADRIRSVSVWRGAQVTDRRGRLRLSLTAPDFDGELVAMAVAAGRRSVAGVSQALKVRRPVLMQTGLPRFLAPGDRALATLRLQNTTATEVSAEVWLTMTGAVAAQGASDEGDGNEGDGDEGASDEGASDEGAGEEGDRRSVRVSAGGHTNLAFPLVATAVGQAEVTFHCRLPDDELEKVVELAVRPAAPPLTVSESHVVDAGGSLTLKPPGDFLEGTARSELVLSTSPFPIVEGSLRYLLSYPYGCVEQISSKLMPWLALSDYLQSTGSEEYTEDEIRETVEDGVERLLSRMTSDGGLALWPGGRSPYLYGTLYAMCVLLEAKAAGYTVPERPFEQLLDYLDRVLSDPEEPDLEKAAVLRAYAVSLLARAGRVREGWIETLYERREDLSAEGRAHLALAAKVGRVALPGPLFSGGQLSGGPLSGGPLSGGKGATETSDSDAKKRDLDGFLYSRPRELCYVLGALVDLGAKREDLLPYLDTLRSMRRDGRFRSTHEDGLFIFAVGRLARLFPSPVDAVTTTVAWDGGEQTLEVKGRTTLPVPPGTLRITAGAGGAVFVFREARGVPVTAIAERDEGLRVRRRFLHVDGRPLAEGTESDGSPPTALSEGEAPTDEADPDVLLRRGESFVVEIELQTSRSLRSVVVVDPLAAGCEIENPRLVTSDGRARVEHRFGLERSELRDDRLILFAHPGSGKSTYRYVARAVTPGRFVLPPIAAECMYDAAVHSVHGGGVVEVVP